MDDNYYSINAKDAQILKDLGRKIAEIGALPQMAELKRLWKKLNALEAERPMLLVETSGVLDEVIPVSSLECEGSWARGVERSLRDKLFHFNFIRDDFIIEPRITYSYKIRTSNYGLEVKRHVGKSDFGIGSTVWEPPIQDIDEGLEKIRFRTYEIDREATMRHVELLENVFSGILPVEHRGWYWWSQGLTEEVIQLIGLEGFMLAVYDQPEAVHRLMAFLRDDYMNRIDWFEKKGLLFPNNQDDYIGSGGCGYTDLLPLEPLAEGGVWKADCMWGLSESQETVLMSPEMFEEFVFPYQLPIISRFGFTCYGCCEPIDKRWRIVKSIPRLRRVSVSPWSSQGQMAENLGRRYVYSRKPNPALISVGAWNEIPLIEDLKTTAELTAAWELNTELVMKDVHTVSKEPQRLGKWVEIARKILYS